MKTEDLLFAYFVILLTTTRNFSIKVLLPDPSRSGVLDSLATPITPSWSRRTFGTVFILCFTSEEMVEQETVDLLQVLQVANNKTRANIIPSDHSQAKSSP